MIEYQHDGPIFILNTEATLIACLPLDDTRSSAIYTSTSSRFQAETHIYAAFETYFFSQNCPCKYLCASALKVRLALILQHNNHLI